MANRHLSEQQIVDLVEGAAGWDVRRHAEACTECADRAKETGETWALLRETPIPEPTPLYWEAFRRQVARRLDTRRAPFWQRTFFPPLLAAAAVLAGLVSFLPLGSVTELQPTLPTLPAWSALPPAEEDAGLTVLAALPAADLAEVGSCDGATDCVELLSDDEGQVLATALRQELKPGRDL